MSVLYKAHSMEVERKLAILADAAKYDASCASSGAPKRHSAAGSGMGSTTGMGICHSYTPDGRCVSLLKILLTNFCLYDCLYCVNRRSSDVPRARFTRERGRRPHARRSIAATTSKGLFLSSGIIADRGLHDGAARRRGARRCARSTTFAATSI